MKACVNERFNFFLDNKGFDWSCVEIRDGQFHIIFNNQSFIADVVEANTTEKNFVISINNNNYRVELKDQFDELLQFLGMDGLKKLKESEIKAPMPGRVLEIMKKPGDSIFKGDTILVLEAMKMENVIKSPDDGIIKKIVVEKNQAVDKNELLVEFE